MDESVVICMINWTENKINYLPKCYRQKCMVICCLIWQLDLERKLSNNHHDFHQYTTSYSWNSIL